MTAPVTTPRAEQIAEDLLRDARAFLSTQGAELASRQVEALARAVARHLAALEDLMLCGWPQREEVLRAGTASRREREDEPRSMRELALPTPLRDAAVGLAEPPATPALPRMLIVQRWDRQEPESVPEGEVRWGLRGLPREAGRDDGRDNPLFAWLLCQELYKPGRVSYIRASSDSPWGVRVEILGEGR